ncbi:MAG: type II secretion system F family protein [Alphaproteobacteria bacterium]
MANALTTGAGAGGGWLSGNRGGTTMSATDRERFFFYMAMMMKTGQPTAESLRVVAKAFKSEKQESIANALMGMAQRVAQGRTLSQAMLNERKMFSDIHRAAILAGEASNNMQKSFDVLRVLEEKKILAGRAGMAEMLTPLMMLILSLVSLFNTGLRTLPIMAKLAESQGKPIGIIPAGIMVLTSFCADYWYVFAGLLGMAIAVFASLVSNPQGRTVLHAAQLQVPVYGRFLVYHTYAQMLLYFPYLLASGVKPKQLIPIMEALASNTIIRRRIDQFNHVITTGGKLSEAMSRSGFPELVITPVSVAENYAPTSGNTNDVLIEGMQHAHGILERMLADTQQMYVSVFSTVLWLAGGLVMMLDMLSIVMSQA